VDALAGQSGSEPVVSSDLIDVNGVSLADLLTSQHPNLLAAVSRAVDGNDDTPYSGFSSAT
jgi:FXSXX-COOH protein